jgi:sensor histidine kinase regulating citrate/malate metabolism
MTVNVTPLHVADEDFLVASLIERCPKTMMIRELMMNAIEAAQLAPPARRIIEISAQQFDGTSKLAIWNTGPGMDASELLQISNIAASLGKEKSLTGNFGMGAKVAQPTRHSLPFVQEPRRA